MKTAMNFGRAGSKTKRSALTSSEARMAPPDLWPDGTPMSPLDALYAALVREFEVVEISPSVWKQLDPIRWKSEDQGQGLQIVMGSSDRPVAEEAGFEVRPLKFVKMTLCLTEGQYFVRVVGIANANSVPTQANAPTNTVV